MGKSVLIGVIGDYDPARASQVATIDAILRAGRFSNVETKAEWVPTPILETDPELTLEKYDALWCAPGVYTSIDGAINGVRYARERLRPFLGTCGGFQVAAIEYARDVLGMSDAQHIEYHPTAQNPFITYLSCSVAGQAMAVRISPSSKVHRYYGTDHVQEQYRCTMGMSRDNQSLIDARGLHIVGVDANEDARILEIPDHPFFVATLFVPQMNLSENGTHPLILAYLEAALASKLGTACSCD